ncbi:MAG TPA: hypothetical protein VMA95_20910 [Streptosporangiaceae bacterium]|nr:hypothetical protein [Streptosporangiaceae bacterium]
MDDQIHLRLGAKPWQAADTARLSKVLNHYDVPLAGILKQHGAHFLFECLEGEVQEANIWAYVPLTRSAARRMTRLTGERLTDAMHSAYRDQVITAALAVDGAIVRGTTFDFRAQDLRTEAARQVKRKVDQDSTAMNGLVAVA